MPAGGRPAVTAAPGIHLGLQLLMAYSEALFTAAAASCLLALRNQRWLAAGIAAGIACLTRPTGGCLILAIAVAGWDAIRQRADRADRRALVRQVVGALVVSVG